MPPTTLKLPPKLKQRIKAVIAGTDSSAHAFMLRAIEREVEAAEKRESFVAEALEARADFQRTRQGYGAGEVHAYLRARVGGAKVARPKIRRWRK